MATITYEKEVIFKNFKQVCRSIKLNYIFWISCGISIYLLTKYNTNIDSYFVSILSFLLAVLLGYYIHYLAHAYDWSKTYSKSDNTVIDYIKSSEYLDKFFRGLICYTFDFHDKVHHDSSVNKQPINVLVEFIQNFMMEGGFLILLASASSFQIKVGNSTFKFNRAILLMWGLLYATVHNINYRIVYSLDPENSLNQHSLHHKHPKTNYGIDTLDILFDTKYNLDNIEVFNHAAINVLIITFIILYFKIYL